MTKLEVDFKKAGPIRLLPLDTSSLFLPFGRPVGDYIRGVAGRENGLWKLTRQEPLEFPVEILWRRMTVSGLTVSSLDQGEDEKKLAEESREIEPTTAGFLGAALSLTPRGGLDTGKNHPVRVDLGGLRVILPKAEALPLRPKITLAPPPAKVIKQGLPAQAAAKPAAPAPVPAKPAPKAPPAAKPVLVAKPPADVEKKPAVEVDKKAPIEIDRKLAIETDRKLAAETEKKPPVEAGKKPSVESDKSDKTVSTEPEGKKPVPVEVAKKPAPAEPEKKPVAEAASKAAPAKPVIIPAKPTPPQPVQKAPAAAATPAPAVTPKPEPAPAAKVPDGKPEVNQTPRPEPASQAAEISGAAETPVPTFGGFLLGSRASDRPDEEGFPARIPLLAKIGVPAVVVGLAGYFLVGGVSTQPSARQAPAPAAIVVGEQGWVTRDAEDTVGSRRARQLQFYEPSRGLSDYDLEFAGAVETKALGWFFRGLDTKNYYGMKIEFTGPGNAVLTHFAVVEGRESSYDQRPLAINAGPGAPIPIKMEVRGARFAVSVQGQPVEVWTDNRLRSGAVGFMNERDEFGRTSHVLFRAPGAGK